MARMTSAQRAVHPDHAIALAYRAGWQASAKSDGPELETAELRYESRHSAAELDAWQAGWMDYASDYAYGTGIRPVSATTAPEPTTAKDPTMTRTNTLQTIAQGAQGDAAAAPAPLPRVAFTDAEAIARVMMCGDGIARGRGIVIDWADVPEELSEMIRDGVFGSRCVRLSTLAQDASESDPIGPETRAYLTTLPRTPYVPMRATHTRGR